MNAMVRPTRIAWSHRDERLVLRPIAVGDAVPLTAGIHDSVAELRHHMPWAHHPQTLEAQFERCAVAQGDYWTGGDAILSLWGDDGAWRGSFGLHRRTLNSRAFEIGFWVHSAHAGRGYATAATRALIAVGFEVMGLDRVQCAYNVTNEASRKVQQRCGFREEGRMRRFETAPTAEMVAAGYRGGDVTVIMGILRDEARAEPWYAPLCADLEVDDWRGERRRLTTTA